VHYRLSGVRLICDRPLIGLTPTATLAGVESDIDIHCVLDGRGPLEDPVSWLLVRPFHDRSEPWLSTARIAGGYLLRVHDHADFRFDVARRELYCAPYPGCSEALLDQLLIDQVVPQLLHALGRFSLHASAVEWAGGAIAFAGPSGAGKSTLAASLGASHAIVSDDCLAVALASGSARVLPSYAGARLCRDSAESLFANAAMLPLASPRAPKLRVELPAAAENLALRTIYLLHPNAAGAVRIEPLAAGPAVARLANFVHRLDPSDRERLRAELDFLTELARCVRVAELWYPQDFARMPEVHQALAADVAAADHGRDELKRRSRS
jgi:hypothetical protein